MHPNDAESQMTCSWLLSLGYTEKRNGSKPNVSADAMNSLETYHHSSHVGRVEAFVAQ